MHFFSLTQAWILHNKIQQFLLCFYSRLREGCLLYQHLAMKKKKERKMGNPLSATRLWMHSFHVHSSKISRKLKSNLIYYMIVLNYLTTSKHQWPHTLGRGHCKMVFKYIMQSLRCSRQGRPSLNTKLPLHFWDQNNKAIIWEAGWNTRAISY